MLTVLVPLAAVVAGILLARTTRPVLTVGINEQADVVAVHRHVRFFRYVGSVLALGVLVGGATGALPWSSTRVTAAVPAVAGAVFVLAVVLGELSVRVPVTLARTASLETRSPSALTPRVGATVVLTGLTALAVLLVVGVVRGGPDDLGRAGRMLLSVCRDAQGQASHHGNGPWPGSYYALPITAVILLCVVMSAVGLLIVARRRSPSAESAGLDSVVRRWSAAAIVQGLGVAVFGTLAPVSVAMASAVGGSCVPARPFWAAVLTVVAALAGICLVVMLARVLVSPLLRVEDLPRATPGDPGAVREPVR